MERVDCPKGSIEGMAGFAGNHVDEGLAIRASEARGVAIAEEPLCRRENVGLAASEFRTPCMGGVTIWIMPMPSHITASVVMPVMPRPMMMNVVMMDVVMVGVVVMAMPPCMRLGMAAKRKSHYERQKQRDDYTKHGWRIVLFAIEHDTSYG
jgi:hypothetical protein